MSNAHATLGPYRLLRLLGEGGMARVFEGEHTETGARHAIKELVLDLGDVEALQRFRREAELAVALNHPHIARTYTAVLAPPQPFLALELLGESLEDRLAAGPLSSSEARRILAEVASGVAHAHAQGVIHRDLKPGNILFSAEGAAKVTDFGIAVGARVERLTQTGELLGTPSYMAPEQIDDPHAVDARADVYALGAILYAALSGRAPFSGRSNLLSTLLAVRSEAPPSLPPGVDPGLEAACLKALAKAPARRFESVEAFRSALHEQPAPRRAWLVGLLGVAALLVLTVVLLARPESGAPRAGVSASDQESHAPLRPTAPAPTPSPLPARGFVRLRRGHATGPRAEVLVSHMTDGRLAVYEDRLLIVGAKRIKIAWDGALRKTGAGFPRFLLALDETHAILGHPGRPLLWTSLPALTSHMGATVALRHQGVVLIGSHRRFANGQRSFLRALDPRTGSHYAQVRVGEDDVRALAGGPRGAVFVGLGTLGGLNGTGTLLLYRLTKGQLTFEQSRAVMFTPNVLTVSPDGDRFAVGSVQGQVSIERAADLSSVGPLVGVGRFLGAGARAHIDCLVAARYLNSERLLTVGRAGHKETDHGRVKVWDAVSRKLIASTTLGLRPRHASIYLRPDGTASIAVGGLGRFEEWSYRE